jgi:HAD superfamily hydrolase (TIGR01509 family)
MTSATGTLSVEAIVFDMDGVLVDSEPLHTRATKLVLAECGLDWDERESAEHIGLTDVESFAALARRHRLAGDPTALAARWAERTIALLQQHARPLRGVPSVPLALRARGHRLALASSSRPSVIAATLDAIGARPLFEVVVSGAEVPRGKPSPDVFLEAARRLEVPPGRCLVIEDSRHGVTAARAAGMRCVAIPCATTSHQDLTHATVRLNALPELLGYLDLLTTRAA